MTALCIITAAAALAAPGTPDQAPAPEDLTVPRPEARMEVSLLAGVWLPAWGVKQRSAPATRRSTLRPS